MMDMIWLDMVEDLRQFSCSIEKIRQAKGQLHVRYKNMEAAYPLLALFIFIMISNYNPVCLKIYPDGGLKHLLQRGVSPCYFNLCDRDDDEISCFEVRRKSMGSVFPEKLIFSKNKYRSPI